MKQILGALALLLAGLAWNNGWKWAPPEHAGRVFVASSGAFIAALLLWGALLVRSKPIGYALQVAGCNALYIVAPWPVRTNDELCSTRIGLPLGLLGLWMATMLAQWIYSTRKTHARASD